MIVEKLLDKLTKILNQDREKQEKRKDKLHALLKKLRKRYKQFKKDLETETDPAVRKQLKQNLAILKIQRKKAIKLCKELKCKK